MIGLAAGLLAAATSAVPSYGNSLLDTMHHRHAEIASAQISIVNGKDPPIIFERRWKVPAITSERRVLLDANGNEIGAIVLGSLCSSFTTANVVASELSRHIYSPASLSDPDPFVAGAIRAPTAQAVIEGALAHDPTIITLAFHVTPPGEMTNAIVASSFGRIGKPADADDARIIHEGTIVRETTNKGGRLAVELPLLDFQRHIIGALSTSFRLDPGADELKIEKRAVDLRDALSLRTPSIKALFRPATASRQVRALPTCHR